MFLNIKVCLVVSGLFFTAIIDLKYCRKLDGYKFPVYTTAFCPRFETEWAERSSALHCNKSNGYMCLPNENFDELLEFCYIERVVRIQKGICLYLVKRFSLVNGYNCSRFTQGCPSQPFFSFEIFKNPACISIGNGCFLAEPSCKSIPPPNIQQTTQQFENILVNEWNGSTIIQPQQSSEHAQLDNPAINDNDDALFVPVLLGISIPLCVLTLLCGFMYYIKGKSEICKTNGDVESSGREEKNVMEEIKPLLEDGDHDDKGTGSLETEVINATTNAVQQIKGTSEKHEGKIVTPDIEKDKDMAVQEGEICKTNGDVESLGREEKNVMEEIKQLLEDGNHDYKGTGSLETEGINATTNAVQQIKGTSEIHEESTLEKGIFDQWKNDDSCFISTKACEEVETNMKGRNLVIVSGHSGSGKSAIIQHIALQYREQQWTVKRVTKIEDILDIYESSRFQKNRTLCVFNDPLGKESFDEILNNSWQNYEEELNVYVQTAKLVMSCRNHIISDSRVTRTLVNKSFVVNIDNNKYKLSDHEKRQILHKYTSGMNLSEKDCDEIVKVEKHFPLLCKLYSKKEVYKNKGIEFFTEPVAVLKEEILSFRRKDMGKYCCLALLVLFNDDLCVSDLLKNKDTKYKFKLTLELCGLSENTPPSDIGDKLKSIKDCFVKSIGDTYHFYHDFVMEVTTLVFGKDYPAETVKYADIGFLRRRVILGEDKNDDDSFYIYLGDRYITELGGRLFAELFGERVLDVVLNPCLRNEKIIEVLKEKIADPQENLQLLLETKKLTIDKQQLNWTSKRVLLSKLRFLELDNEVSPLFALIVFCHTQLSQYCVDTLQQKQIDSLSCSLISAICCNGSIELFKYVLKDNTDDSLNKTWGGLYPIHIVSVFHNYELLKELIKKGVDVNQKINNNGIWAPLILAVSNDTQEYEHFYHNESCEKRKNSTVQLLLSNGADINLCMKNGASPLFIACHDGNDSTVKLLLRNGANINLCMKNGASPLYVACQNRHYSTVQLLLSNGADINLCMEDGASPLFIACHNGHDVTVQLLLSKGANINLCMEGGASPLFIACHYGHDSTVKLLLSNGADINLCIEDGTSPLFLACRNGHDSTVQLLLSNGADIKLCMKNGASPLYVACHEGHDSTVQLLLSNGADINLCMEDGACPLFIACQNGHDSTVKLLLRNEANINLCMEDGASPLYIACQNGHDSTE